MNAKEYDLIVEAFSRRKFLRTCSTVLAAAALAGECSPSKKGR
jgi:hypothetical protein